MESEKSKAVIGVVRASRPLFRSRHDRLAFAVHASFLASGYSLAATGRAAYAADALSSSAGEYVGIERWNEADDEYAFVYVSPEDSKKVLVKCLAMDDKLAVDALKDGAAEPVHLEIDIDEFIVEDGAASYSGQFKNLDKLVKSLDTEILSKLDGSSRPSSSTNAVGRENSEGSRQRINEPGLAPREPWSPQVHPSGVVCPPVYPLGGNDLFPGPGAGMYPTRGGYGSSGSILLGPNDPSWFGGDAGHPGFPGAQPGVPPGARFDPYGPPGVPGFEPSRFVRNPRRPGGGTHPDLEHFRDGSDFI
ncbi:probable proteasome inhibitor isoform X1 [Syzygium oleosum]|uniref:probable proteasome inhibitor isoform X1 n=1 Tax=Syzygium oleosum TaxID=219896 RepID=UPI0024BA833A|nr:probable proteasome inhibitor isoform X1 [Syzygium oleosum]